jgi:hypothetical protein
VTATPFMLVTTLCIRPHRYWDKIGAQRWIGNGFWISVSSEMQLHHAIPLSPRRNIRAIDDDII